MNVLIENSYLLTFNQTNEVIKDGAIYLENDKIIDYGTSDSLHSKYKNAEHIINAKGRIVMPGFTCAHMHFYSAFVTGMSIPTFEKGFVNVLKHLWWKLDQALDKESTYYSALLGYIQAVKSGTTTIIDHHASPNFVVGSLDEIERAGRKLGVRSNLCYEITDRNGPEEANAGIRENERFINKMEHSNDDLISGMVGLHASFTLDHESMSAAQNLVQEFDTGVHIHVAEDKADMDHAKSTYNSTVIQRLEKYQLLNQKTLLAHCIHVEDADYELMKRFDVNITHQPRSNMNNAVGTMDLLEMLDDSLLVGMGTDGMSADMKAEIITGNLIHKNQARNNTIGTVEIYETLFKNNPRIFEKITNTKIGSLVQGSKADLIISNYYPKSPVHSENTIGHVLFGVVNEPVATTIIDGKIRMLEGKLLNIDEEKISQKCQQIAPKVWERFSELPDYE